MYWAGFSRGSGPKDGCVPQRGFTRWTCIYGCPGEAENLVAAQPIKLDSSDVPSLALETLKFLGERTALFCLHWKTEEAMF